VGLNIENLDKTNIQHSLFTKQKNLYKRLSLNLQKKLSRKYVVYTVDDFKYDLNPILIITKETPYNNPSIQLSSTGSITTFSPTTIINTLNKNDNLLDSTLDFNLTRAVLQTKVLPNSFNVVSNLLNVFTNMIGATNHTNKHIFKTRTNLAYSDLLFKK